MLEIKIILHPANGGPKREIANMQITQIEMGEDNLRDYAVNAWHQSLKTSEPVREYSAVVDHDRMSSPWALVRKAIAGLR